MSEPKQEALLSVPHKYIPSLYQPDQTTINTLVGLLTALASNGGAICDDCLGWRLAKPGRLGPGIAPPHLFWPDEDGWCRSCGLSQSDGHHGSR